MTKSLPGLLVGLRVTLRGQGEMRKSGWPYGYQVDRGLQPLSSGCDSEALWLCSTAPCRSHTSVSFIEASVSIVFPVESLSDIPQVMNFLFVFETGDCG